MKSILAIVVGALLIAGSILFIGRWQIAALGYGYAGGGDRGDTAEEKVFRLDRWTGDIEYCAIGGSDPQGFEDRAGKTGHAVFTCSFPKGTASGQAPAGPPPSE
jgi:hypothetical protein